MNRITQLMKRNVWPLMLLLILTMSCNNDDESPTRQINLTVQNEAGMAIEGAQVVLYGNKEDWEQEQNSIESGMATDADGIVEFVGLEPGTYYLDAEKDGATNWSSQTTFVQPEAFAQTELTIEIGVSQIDLLVGKVGKEYSYADVRIEGISLFAEVDPCEKDDTVEFIREGRAGLEKINALSCESDQPASRTFVWNLSSNGDMLSLSYSDGESLEYSLLTLDEDNLVISTDIELEGQIFPADFYFESK